MLIAHLDKISATVYVDNGTGNNRKVLQLNSSTRFLEIRYAVIGLQEISGNCPPFSVKGKNFPAGCIQECEILVCNEFTGNDIRGPTHGEPTSRRNFRKFYLCDIWYTKINLSCAAIF